MSNDSVKCERHTHLERVAQAFSECANATASADMFQNMKSQLLDCFRNQGCALRVAEELAQKVTGEFTARVREVLRWPGLGPSWMSGVIQIGELKLVWSVKPSGVAMPKFIFRPK